MIALFCLCLALFVSPFKSKSRLEAENIALRHQLIILRRKVRGRMLTHVIVLSLALRSLSPASRSIWSSDAERRPRDGAPPAGGSRQLLHVVPLEPPAGRASYPWKSTRREGFRIHAGSAAQLIAMPVHLGLPVLGIPLVHHGAVVEAQQLRRAGVWQQQPHYLLIP